MARRVQGLPELKRKLTRLRENTADHVKGQMEIAAESIVQHMRSLVAVDEGDARDSIGWCWGPPPKGSISVSVGRIRGGKSKVRSRGGSGNMSLTIFAGNEKAFHVRWLEFGTAPHPQGGQFPGTQHPGNPPQPFFYPAFRAGKKQAVAGSRKAIREAVREAVR